MHKLSAVWLKEHTTVAKMFVYIWYFEKQSRFLTREFYLLCCLNLTDQLFYKIYHENAHKNLNNHKQKNKRMFLCSNNSIIKIMSMWTFCFMINNLQKLKSTFAYKTSVNYEVHFFDRDKKMAVTLSWRSSLTWWKLLHSWSINMYEEHFILNTLF